ncbi:GNAT family N-acetyltransferase [Intestinibacter sp.]
MLHTKVVNSKLPEYKKLLSIYDDAFPKDEQFPMLMLRLMAKRKCIDFLAFYDGDVFCGFTYLIHHKNTTFILYLAIDKNIRSKGYGTQILNWIAYNYENHTIVLNIEPVDEKCDNYEQRLSRQKFYFKNGFDSSGYKFHTKDCVFDTLYKGDVFDKEKFEKLIKKFSFGFSSIDLSK